jgi:dihydroflavonol-4-reductase
VGERYVLGGENVTMGELFTTIATLAGKAPPRLSVGYGAAAVTGALLSSIAAITGETPAISYDVVRGSFGRYFWVSSEKAQRELGYSARPARQALARSVRYYVDHGYLSPGELRRLRLDPATMAAA